MTKYRKSKYPVNVTGYVIIYEAYHEGVKAGVGHSLYFNGHTTPPFLCNDIGQQLEADWYSLTVIENRLAVINVTIQ